MQFRTKYYDNLTMYQYNPMFGVSVIY